MVPGAASARACTFALLAAVSLTGACRHHLPAPTAEKSPPPAATCAPAPQTEVAKDPEPPPRPLRRCFEDVPPWVDSSVALLLDRAGEHLDRNDAEGALACAEEAARQAPRSVEAHHDRAVSLIRLGRFDEARDALALALSIAPSDPETLELAADFYVTHLPPSAERAAIGLEYARRGSRNP